MHSLPEEFGVAQFLDAVMSPLSGDMFMQAALQGRLKVPDFCFLSSTMQDIFAHCKQHINGGKADPKFERVSDCFGVAFCSTSGQKVSAGDVGAIPLGELSYVVNYCLTQAKLGPDRVHDSIGREPSPCGEQLMHVSINSDGLPCACRRPSSHSYGMLCESELSRSHSNAPLALSPSQVQPPHPQRRPGHEPPAGCAREPHRHRRSVRAGGGWRARMLQIRGVSFIDRAVFCIYKNKLKNGPPVFTRSSGGVVGATKAGSCSERSKKEVDSSYCLAYALG